MRAMTTLLLTLTSATAFPDTVTQIIDTGPGLATVTRFGDGRIMIYDTGHWNHDDDLLAAFRGFIGDHDIDLLITSHSDSDHLAATDELFDSYRVHRVIRTGYFNDAGTWNAHDGAIDEAAALGLTHDINLERYDLPHGTRYTFGEATVTYLSGFHRTPGHWGIDDDSEYRNANSIVVRLDYQGNSILFTGDAVGRVEGTLDHAAAIGTEAYLIENRDHRPIASTILIAPHHGGDDASSTDFISAVNARWVIFSAGNDHEHPLAVTAGRYTGLGYDAECLLRTDLGGDDDDDEEWDFGRIDGETDPAFDDSIEIILQDNGRDPDVRYIGGSRVRCPDLGLSFNGGAAPTAGSVRMSRSSICHAPGTRWYEATVHFEEYDSIEACLDAGGRLPR